jgi:DNA primase
MQQYEASLPASPAAEYLEDRGLHPDEIGHFHLGYVGEPLRGHEMYRGMLAIPYLRKLDGRNGGGLVVSIRFRCLLPHEHQGHGKYNTEPGDKGRLFNTVALTEPVDKIAVTEGELDTITAELCGIESVGVPGATQWQPHFPEPFLGYETVWVLADGDEAGMRFAHKVAETLPNARIIPMPEGDDVNSLYMREGPQAVRERVGIEDSD